MLIQALRIYHAFSPLTIRLLSILGVLPMAFFKFPPDIQVVVVVA